MRICNVGFECISVKEILLRYLIPVSFYGISADEDFVDWKKN
jgi:hypothetical protein